MTNIRSELPPRDNQTLKQPCKEMSYQIHVSWVLGCGMSNISILPSLFECYAKIWFIPCEIICSNVASSDGELKPSKLST